MKKLDVKSIDKLLPQTQCGECDYAGCLPYAEAIASGQAEINRCPPGGIKTLKALAELLDKDPRPFLDEMAAKTRAASIAEIREDECIGCTKCIQACPVDAIIGSSKRMHAVLADECTGCGLCVEPCPVDCIDIKALDEPVYQPDKARERYQARQARALAGLREKEDKYRQKRLLAASQQSSAKERQAKQDYILQALERVKAKKHE